MSASQTPDPKLHRLLTAAARDFNSQRYFEAHEVLEEGLEEVPDALWQLALGLIQVAVGYHKVTQRLHRGATRMLALGLEKMDHVAADATTLDLESLRQRVRADVQRLRTQQFDAVEFARQPPRMRFRCRA
jgi:predicted metal-dependent hydrolase